MGFLSAQVVDFVSVTHDCLVLKLYRVRNYSLLWFV
jgi:hypothetical protein